MTWREHIIAEYVSKNPEGHARHTGSGTHARDADGPDATLSPTQRQDASTCEGLAGGSRVRDEVSSESVCHAVCAS